MIAVKKKKKTLIDLFIQKEANVLVKTKDGNNLLHLALKCP